jgi:hypothetical protein
MAELDPRGHGPHAPLARVFPDQLTFVHVFHRPTICDIHVARTRSIFSSFDSLRLLV